MSKPDPYRLMPTIRTKHPRVFFSDEQLTFIRDAKTGNPIVERSLSRLLCNCNLEEKLPARLPNPIDASLNAKAANQIKRNALAALLTDDPRYSQKALDWFNLIGDGYFEWEPGEASCRATQGGLAESSINLTLAQSYDLLSVHGLPPAEDQRFRKILQDAVKLARPRPHVSCGNHNSWTLTSLLAIGLALNEPELVHNCLYGFEDDPRRYGFVHQLRHDFLTDGHHWERTCGYHLYTLMAFSEAANMLSLNGSDLWHAELPSMMIRDNLDLHRAYGPEGMKCLKSAFDIPFYLMLGNGDLSLLGDSGIANIRGYWVWGIPYNLAYEAYRDSKYAWLINKAEKEYGPNREFSDLPLFLQSSRGDTDFARLRLFTFPNARFSHTRNCPVSIAGRQENGSTLLPVHGTAILRADHGKRNAPGAALFYGPHSAGHQSPAALHLDISNGKCMIADAPRMHGYDDPAYLSWKRSTVAHNTVTVDQTSMFPYNQLVGSIWDCDHHYPENTDGQLQFFQPGQTFAAARALNKAVYPGTTLDRAILLTNDYLLDVFRVSSNRQHTYDWAMHVAGRLQHNYEETTADLGNNHGYSHLTNTRRIETDNKTKPLFSLIPEHGTHVSLQLMLPKQSSIYLSDDHCQTSKDIGDLSEPGLRKSLVVRCKTRETTFVALWRFSPKDNIMLTSYDPGKGLLEINENTQPVKWLINTEGFERIT